MVQGFSLSGWISKQYLRVFGGTEFEDQLEIPQLFWLEDILVYQKIYGILE